jgi:hypothetical protein
MYDFRFKDSELEQYVSFCSRKIYTQVWWYVCVFVYSDACVCMYVCVCTSTCVCMYMSMNVCVYTMDACVCVCACMCVCVCACIYDRQAYCQNFVIIIYAYIHAHMYACMYSHYKKRCAESECMHIIYTYIHSRRHPWSN